MTRVLIWIVEDTWAATIAGARPLLPADAEVTLLHVAPGDVEGVAAGARTGLLGRRPPPPPPHHHTIRDISDEAAAEVLADAAAMAGGDPPTRALRGRVEHEVVAAAEGFDLLVLARDGDVTRAGPKSLAPPTRFVVDHAPCAVLLLWPSR